jgi:hypothetical protein
VSRVTRSAAPRSRSERGFVATELALGIAVLLVPVACLVLTLPTWSERKTTARAIVREVARVVASTGVCDHDSARGLTAIMARNLGLPDGDATVELRCSPGAALVPGSELEAAVTVRMPAVDIPGVGPVGEWSWTARHRQPVDRYVSS